jgi:hypothetical protein
MSNNKRESVTPDISPIIETYDERGIGLLGFTIKNPESGFENIIREFNADNRDDVYAELNKLRKKLSKLLN